MNTLFDLIDEEIAYQEQLFYCTNCKQYLPISRFYLQQYSNLPRCHCKECWKKTNGRSQTSSEPVQTLEQYFNFVEPKKISIYEKYNIDPTTKIRSKHAAKILRLKQTTIGDYCSKGFLDAEKIDGKWHINLQSVLEYYDGDFAIKNYLEDQEKHKIIDIIQHSVYAGEFNINHERRNCRVEVGKETRQCVYFIVQFLNGVIDFSKDNAVIQKVGKADGEEGLYGRISGYNCDNVDKPDRSITKLYNVFNEQLNGQTLHLFYIPFEPIITDIPGNFTVEVSRAREAEKMYAYYARVQGHPLLLSSYD
jgi:hypothetical protein